MQQEAKFINGIDALCCVVFLLVPRRNGRRLSVEIAMSKFPPESSGRPRSLSISIYARVHFSNGVLISRDHFVCTISVVSRPLGPARLNGWCRCNLHENDIGIG